MMTIKNDITLNQSVGQSKKRKQVPRKKLIFIEAAKLFMKIGYNATSMRDIANAVGIEPSSLYSHIKSKDQLLQKICFDCGILFLKGLKDIQARDLTSIEKIELLIGMHIQIAKEDSTSATVFSNEWKHLRNEDLVDFIKMRKDYEKGFIEIIDAAIGEGDLRPMNAKIILHTILSSIRWVQLGIGSKEKWNTEELTHQISDILLNGIKQPSQNYKYESID